MKIYVAGASAEYERAAAAMDWCRAQGFEITHDWVQDVIKWRVDGGKSDAELAGASSTKWRERIGNAVPPPTARAIAEQMLIALVEEFEGTMMLRGDGAVWVEPAELGGLETGRP